MRSLPYGTLVAIGVADEAAQGLTADARNEIYLIGGGPPIVNLQYRGTDTGRGDWERWGEWGGWHWLWDGCWRGISELTIRVCRRLAPESYVVIGVRGASYDSSAEDGGNGTGDCARGARATAVRWRWEVMPGVSADPYICGVLPRTGRLGCVLQRRSGTLLDLRLAGACLWSPVIGVGGAPGKFIFRMFKDLFADGKNSVLDPPIFLFSKRNYSLFLFYTDFPYTPHNPLSPNTLTLLLCSVIQ